MSLKRHPLIVLFGSWGRENIVLRLVEDGYQIAKVVVPQPESPNLTASIERIKAAGLEVAACRKASLAEVLHPLAGGVLLSVGFPYIVASEILERFRMCLNVHPTLLPRYRGPTSGAFIIINNEKETGSTVHLMDAGMDTGAIVAQSRVALTRYDTTRSMQRKVYAAEPDLVLRALELLDRPDFTPQAQDESLATEYPARRKPADSEIDASKSLRELYDSIRACDPTDYPAFFHIDDQRICIKLWRPERPDDEMEDAL